jgi:biopolymer transport protein ExbB
MRTSLIVFGSVVFLCLTLPPALAQESSAPVDQSAQISEGPQGNVAAEDSSSDATAEAKSFTRNVSDELVRLGIPQPLPFLWDLAVQGGLFMIPIALCSIVVMAYAIERRIGLRRNLIIPPGLLVGLQKLNQQSSGIDPRLAYDVCLKYRSPLSRVLQAAILKVGRPQAELEKAVEDAVSREADQMAQNIRPINVAVSISPMLGLLGTVQGMIMAFMVISASTSTGTAKGQELAQGIYTALITTFAGLVVAIPAIVIANMLEGRIERLLRGMEDVFNEIVPLFERFEGKWRVTRKSDASGVLLKGTGSRPESTSSSKNGNGEMNATIDDRSALRTVTAPSSPGVREKS